MDLTSESSGIPSALRRALFLLVHEIYVVSVPLYLIVVDIVVLPHYSEVVAVGVGVAVEYVNRLSEQSLGVLDVYYLVAVAVNVVGSLLEQAVFEFRTAVEVGDLLAGVVAVDLGIVVAEGDRPIYAAASSMSAANSLADKRLLNVPALKKTGNAMSPVTTTRSGFSVWIIVATAFSACAPA